MYRRSDRAINSLLILEQCYFQQNGALPYYHNDVKDFLTDNFPGSWFERRETAEYPPRYPG